MPFAPQGIALNPKYHSSWCMWMMATENTWSLSWLLRVVFFAHLKFSLVSYCNLTISQHVPDHQKYDFLQLLLIQLDSKQPLYDFTMNAIGVSITLFWFIVCVFQQIVSLNKYHLYSLHHIHLFRKSQYNSILILLFLINYLHLILAYATWYKFTYYCRI